MNGATVDPDVVDRRLFRLCMFHGDERDLGFYSAIMRSLDIQDWLDGIEWTLAYLGRYMRQPIEYLEHIEYRRLRHFVEIISEMLKAEAGPLAKNTETNYT